MMIKTGSRKFTVLMAVLLLMTGCTLDEPGISGTNFPLTLQAETNLSLVKLSWPAVKVTGFKEYILLQSTDEIPVSDEPEVSANVTILKRIDDASVTSFHATDVLFSSKVCYKLFVSIDDRFIQSQSLCLEREFKTLPGFYERAGHEKGFDEIVMFDRFNNHLTSYNYKQDVITNTVNVFDLFFPVIEISTLEGSTNVFAYDQSTAALKKYSFPGLTLEISKPFNNVLYSIKPHHQFVFASSEESGKSFRVLNRSNLSEIDAEQGLLGSRNIAVFEGDPVTVLETGVTGISRYTIDVNGKITFLETKTPGMSQPGIQSSTAQGNSVFIGGSLGDIIDRDGVVLGSLLDNSNSFIMMSRLSEDEKKVVYIVSDNITIHLEVADISNLQNITILSSYNLPLASYADMIIDGVVINVFGASFSSGLTESFFLKYPMP